MRRDSAYADLLHRYLELADARCPRCDYALHALQSDRCPECGAWLELRVGIQESMAFPFGLGLAPLLAMAGMNGLLFILGVLSSAGRGSGKRGGFIVLILLLGLVVGTLLSAFWIDARKRLEAMERMKRRWLIVAAWMVPVLNVLIWIGAAVLV